MVCGVETCFIIFSRKLYVPYDVSVAGKEDLRERLEEWRRHFEEEFPSTPLDPRPDFDEEFRREMDLVSEAEPSTLSRGRLNIHPDLEPKAGLSRPRARDITTKGRAITLPAGAVCFEL